MYVRWPPRIGVVLPRVSSGLYRGEAVIAIMVSQYAARAAEVWIEGRRMIVAIMAITSSSIGLPDLDQRMWNRPAVVVQYPAAHDDALPERFSRVLPRQVGIGGSNCIGPKDRPCYFR